MQSDPFLDAGSKAAVLQSRPIPHPLPGEVLIRVHAVALNPVDALYVFNPIGASGRIIGSDFAGTVESSADDRLAPGQRVAGFVQGVGIAVANSYGSKHFLHTLLCYLL